MSRFLAYRGNEPERLRLAVHSLRGVLFPDVPDEELLSDGAPEQPLSGQKTRWGLGYYVGGEAHVQRFAALPAQGYFALRALRCEVALGQGSEAAADASPQQASPHRYGRLQLSLQTQPGGGSTMMVINRGAPAWRVGARGKLLGSAVPAGEVDVAAAGSGGEGAGGLGGGAEPEGRKDDREVDEREEREGCGEPHALREETR